MSVETEISVAEIGAAAAAIVGDGLAWPRRVPGRSGLP